MRALRHLFTDPVSRSADADRRLDTLTVYSALSFLALIVLATLPHRLF
ncbi:MAG: hypothetical protein ACOY4O_18430 [Pseudomonadota bacterium]|jgi:hypothetical protein